MLLIHLVHLELSQVAQLGNILEQLLQLQDLLSGYVPEAQDDNSHWMQYDLVHNLQLEENLSVHSVVISEVELPDTVTLEFFNFLILPE